MILLILEFIIISISLVPASLAADKNLIVSELHPIEECDSIMSIGRPWAAPEFVLLDQPYSQKPMVHKIGPEWYRDFAADYLNGDSVTKLEVFPGGNPTYVARLIAQGLIAGPSQVLPLLTGSPNKGTNSSVQTLNGNSLLPKTKTISTLSNFEIIKRYQELVEGDRLDENTIHLIAERLQHDPEMLRLARQLSDYFEIAKPMVSLSNKGILRYFYFQPDGYAHSVPARVLDITQYRPITSSSRAHKYYKILVEWLEVRSAEKQRVRHVKSLSPNELTTIQADNIVMREAAENNFLETLTETELASVLRAANSNLPPWSFLDFRASDSTTFPQTSEHADPLSTMSNFSHLAMEVNFLEGFGSLNAFLSDEEKSRGHWNIIDVFSRQTPDVVLAKLTNPPDNFEFIWVITENGTLKICPFMRGKQYLVPQLLRLSHGRSIFASGRFKFNARGMLSVTTESRGYTNDSPFSGGHDFRANAEDYFTLPVFVARAFFEQAHVKVSNVDNTDLQNIVPRIGELPENPYAEWTKGKIARSGRSLGPDPKEKK